MARNGLARVFPSALSHGPSAAPHGSVYAPACPSRAVLELVADKWALLVVWFLRDGPRRNGVLMREIGGVSQKMLTQTLRELERNGLVVRIDHAEVPPRVEYELTVLGHSLSELAAGLGRWAERHMGDVEAARAAFEERAGAGTQHQASSAGRPVEPRSTSPEYSPSDTRRSPDGSE